MIQNDICESCKNRLRNDICKDCRYATESYYEPVEMNFSEAYKKLSEGKTIYRGHGFWNKHNCTNSVFTSEDFLAEDWRVFDDEKVFIKKSDWRKMDEKRSELDIFKSDVARIISNAIPDLKCRPDSYICNLVLKCNSIEDIKKELKRR